ncbi:MAG: competence protein ComEC, partial [Clostridium sp.]
MTRPLVYYAITIFMGCVTVLITIINPIVGAVIAASFLTIMYFTIDKHFFYLVVCFFIIGAVNYYAYFNVNLPNKEKLEVRISDKSTYYCYAKYNDKKILLEGNTFKLIEGRSVWIIGNFKKNPVYERGVVGTYKVKDYKICNED